MKLIRCVVLLSVAAFLFPGLALAIDYGVPDTLRIDTIDWAINSEADSISPPIGIYGFSDYHTSWPTPAWSTDSVLIGVSTSFWVRVDTDGWDTDRWGLTSEPVTYLGDTYERPWSSVDSFITVKEFVFDGGISGGVPGAITSLADGGARYNGFQMGIVAIFPPPPALPDSVPTKIGDVYLRMSFPRDSIMPNAFDIIIDSAFVPPAGIFKFSEKFMGTGFPPKFVQGVVHVTSQNPMDADGSDPGVQVPISYELSQNFPNPFNPTTTIKFSLETRGFVDLSVYNILGRRVKTLVSTEMDAGGHDVLWDGMDASGNMAASGVYFYKLEAGDFVKTKKMLMLK